MEHLFSVNFYGILTEMVMNILQADNVGTDLCWIKWLWIFNRWAMTDKARSNFRLSCFGLHSAHLNNAWQCHGICILGLHMVDKVMNNVWRGHEYAGFADSASPPKQSSEISRSDRSSSKSDRSSTRSDRNSTRINRLSWMGMSGWSALLETSLTNKQPILPNYHIIRII